MNDFQDPSGVIDHIGLSQAQILYHLFNLDDARLGKTTHGAHINNKSVILLGNSPKYPKFALFWRDQSPGN